MSFKDKFQSWINYSDDNYVDGVEQAADDDFDFAPGDEPAARPQPQTQPKAFRTKSNNNVVSINSPKPAPTKPSVVFQQIDKFEDVNKVADILSQVVYVLPSMAVQVVGFDLLKRDYPSC